MPEMLDFLIIGAGPAGVQMGYFLERDHHKYLILEAGDAPGAFFQSLPRRRMLISINKRYTGYDDREINLRWDWNSLLSDDEGHRPFTEFSKDYFPKADALLEYLAEFVRHHDLKVRYGVRVTRISKAGHFQVEDNQGNAYLCRRLIMATGVSIPYIPTIPGIELAEEYSTMSVNMDDYNGQRVLILGKGNSAFETADQLMHATSLIHVASPHPLKFAWTTHHVGHLRAVNNNLIDTYLLKTQNAILDATIKDIRRSGDKLVVRFSYTHAQGEVEEISYDRVLCCTGFRFDASIFDEDCRPELCDMGKLPAQTSQWESTNVQDLYFVGTLTQYRDYKKSASSFIHGFRYNARSLYRMLMEKYEGVTWPINQFPATPENLTNVIIKRVNRTSALWQLFGFMCDVIVIDTESNRAMHYEEMPVDYVHESKLGESEFYCLLTLEYGSNREFDPFRNERIERTNSQRSSMSNFLHPVIRCFQRGELVGEHHIIEDLAAEWLEDEHIKPVLEFFQEQFRSPIMGNLSEDSGTFETTAMHQT